MGNSATKRDKSRSKGRRKKPSVSEDEEEEEEEEEEVEEEVIEEIVYEGGDEDSEVPSSVTQTHMRSDQTERRTVRGEFTSTIPDKKRLKYQNIQKPLKKAQVFCKHYLSILHRCYGNADFIEDRTWLLRLGEEAHEPSFGGFKDGNQQDVPASNGLKFPDTSRLRQMNTMMQDKGGNVITSSKYAPPTTSPPQYTPPPREEPPKPKPHVTFKDQATPLPIPTQQYPSNNQQLPNWNQSRPPLPPNFQENQRNDFFSSQGEEFYNAQGSIQGQRHRPRDPREFNYTDRTTAPRYSQTQRDQDIEGDFVKTAFNRSEADSELWEDDPRAWSQRLRQQTLDSRRQADLPNIQEECLDCTYSKGKLDEPQSFLSNEEHIKVRNKKIEQNKVQMYENYLENLLAQKPGKLQSLLVQKYYSDIHAPKKSVEFPNRITETLRDWGRDSMHQPVGPLSGHQNSLIVDKLQDKLSERCTNPEPAILTECGVKMIESRGKKVPLKLIKFIKEPSLVKGATPRNSEANNSNIVYLADKYQLDNYIEKQKPKSQPKKKKFKDYAKVKTEQLWPKGVKITKPSFAKEFEQNEISRLSREVDSIQHSLNYAAPKHHPVNFNYLKTDRFLPSNVGSPKWGTPSTKGNNFSMTKNGNNQELDELRKDLLLGRGSSKSPPGSGGNHRPAEGYGSSKDPKYLRQLVKEAVARGNYGEN
jgi:hypothetical protein